MFERRLTQDELGVAIKKISHSGKAQLRYVKCVPLRPPSSSDFDEATQPLVGGAGAGGAGSTGGTFPSARVSVGGVPRCDKLSSPSTAASASHPFLDRDAVGIGPAGSYGSLSVGGGSYTGGGGQRATAVPSDAVSVSSKSSAGSRFLDRVRSASASGIARRLIPAAAAGGSGAGGDAASARDRRGDGARASLRGGSAAAAAAAAAPPGSLLRPEAHDDDDDDDESFDERDRLRDLRSDAADPTSSSSSAHRSRTLRALTWGKKNAVAVPLDRFACVRKGKTTERTRKNASPSGRLLSIVVANVGGNESLDIEAPTALDRDKFASAFARFLGVPLAEEEEGPNNPGGRPAAPSAKKKIRTPSLTRSKKKAPPPAHAARASASRSEPGLVPSPSATPKARNVGYSARGSSDGLLPALAPGSDEAEDADHALAFDGGGDGDRGIGGDDDARQTIGGAPGVPARKAGEDELGPRTPASATAASSRAAAGSRRSSAPGDAAGSAAGSAGTGALSESARKRISLGDSERPAESMLEPRTAASSSTPPLALDDRGGKDSAADGDGDAHSHVSSLTGGVDHEIVEELHQAIIELRSELDASRAEAARAVKVAEQAIQSAENCTSSDWNSTVTHKAAEAAAQAQKRSAEAIARARMAEERLAAERRSTGFWRRQAQAAEEEAGGLKTRSAAAEVRRAAAAEELAGERRRAARMFAGLKSEFVAAERRQAEEAGEVVEQKRAAEAELQECREELRRKDEEARRAAEADVER
ncbi:hypothetical protein ACHAWF_013371 [Thalassiosira exigua]